MKTTGLNAVRWSLDDASLTSAPEKEAPSPFGAAPRVLIVDDDPLLRESVQLALGGLCETIGLSSGAGLEEFVVDFAADIIILDVNLPGRDGFELCRSLRSRANGRAIPVIFLTAQDGDGPFERCLAVRGDAFLSKPFDRVELIETIIRLVPREPPHEPDSR